MGAFHWQEADRETRNKMLEVMGRSSDGYLHDREANNFPGEDLRAIDRLWLKYSNGRFGFSVQKRIYEQLGGTSKYDSKIWEAQERSRRLATRRRLVGLLRPYIR